MEQLIKFLSLSLVLFVASCEKDPPSINIIPCIPDGLQNNVLAFYPFSNGSLDDLLGGNQNLTNSTTAAATMDRNGNLDCAFQFNNIPVSSEFLTRSNASFLNNQTNFSISFWYEPLDTTRDGGDYERLVSKNLSQNWSSENGQWSIGLYDCRKAVFGRTNSVWDNNITNFSCEQEVSTRTNTWHHLVATYKEAGVEMAIYRNALLQDTSLGHANGGSISASSIGDLFLGKDYTGKIDDVIFFDKTLSQQEVNSLYDLEPCCSE